MTKRDRNQLIVLAVIFCLSLIGASLIGIADNLLGIALCYVAILVLFIAWTKRWSEMKKFLILSGISFVGFFIFVILHNAFYALGKITEHIVVLKYLMEVLHVIFFLIAIFVCPMGVLVGIIGYFVIVRRNHRMRKKTR